MIPSIQSPAVIANGSYSRRVNVPSAFRVISRLATCPCFAHEKVLPRLKVVQLGDTIVAVPTMAVFKPFFVVFPLTLPDVPITQKIIPPPPPSKPHTPQHHKPKHGATTISP